MRTLEQLKNRATRYEVEATGPAGRLHLGFTARRGKPGMMAVIRAAAPAILERYRLEDDAKFTISGGGLQVTARIAEAGVRIRFTGRTERDCIMEARQVSHGRCHCGGELGPPVEWGTSGVMVQPCSNCHQDIPV